MVAKKYQMLISIELSEINFNQPTEKGNFRLLVTSKENEPERAYRYAWVDLTQLT